MCNACENNPFVGPGCSQPPYPGDVVVLSRLKERPDPRLQFYRMSIRPEQREGAGRYVGTGQCIPDMSVALVLAVDEEECWNLYVFVDDRFGWVVAGDIHETLQRQADAH